MIKNVCCRVALEQEEQNLRRTYYGSDIETYYVVWGMKQWGREDANGKTVCCPRWVFAERSKSILEFDQRETTTSWMSVTCSDLATQAQDSMDRKKTSHGLPEVS